jgi:hypothetical protein
MRDDLVPEEVEVDPIVRGAALPASQEAAIEGACLDEVADGEGEVKAGPRCHDKWSLRTMCERSKPGR